jgi:hypothetical protein
VINKNALLNIAVKGKHITIHTAVIYNFHSNSCKKRAFELYHEPICGAQSQQLIEFYNSLRKFQQVSEHITSMCQCLCL